MTSILSQLKLNGFNFSQNRLTFDCLIVFDCRSGKLSLKQTKILIVCSYLFISIESQVLCIMFFAKVIDPDRVGRKLRGSTRKKLK